MLFSSGFVAFLTLSLILTCPATRIGPIGEWGPGWAEHDGQWEARNKPRMRCTPEQVIGGLGKLTSSW